MNNLSLVIFTLLTQTSVGIFSTISVQRRLKNLFWYTSSRNKNRGQTLTHVLVAGLYTMGVLLFAAANADMTDHPVFFLPASFGVILLTEIWNRFRFYDSFCRLGL